VKPWQAIATAAGAGLLVGGAVGYAAHRSPPSLHEKQDKAKQESTAKATQTRQDAAPVDVDRRTTRYAPVCPAQAGEPTRPPVVASVTEEHVHRGEVVTETRSAEAAHETEQTHLDLTVTPTSPPGWAVSVGVDDPLGARQVRIALRRRLFGPFAVEVAAVPARGLSGVGAALAVEF
jgi:hypothetical protein